MYIFYKRSWHEATTEANALAEQALITKRRVRLLQWAVFTSTEPQQQPLPSAPEEEDIRDYNNSVMLSDVHPPGFPSHESLNYLSSYGSAKNNRGWVKGWNQHIGKDNLCPFPSIVPHKNKVYGNEESVAFTLFSSGKSS